MSPIKIVAVAVLILVILVIGGGALILAGAARIGNIKAGKSRQLDVKPKTKGGE